MSSGLALLPKMELKYQAGPFFTEEPVKPDQGIGQRTDRFFLSDAKLATLSFKPDLALGFEVQILYNRYGKVENLVLIDQLDSDLEVET